MQFNPYRRQRILFLFLVVFSSMLFGCQNAKKQLLATGESQVKLRQIQTRVFDTTDRKQTLRTVISTMQDLGFVIDKADNSLGTVSGTKLDGYSLRMTVTVRPRGSSQLIVRANAQYNIHGVIVKCGVWKHDQAAFLCRSKVSSSTPSINFTPLITSANRRNPLSFRHPFSALKPSL